MASRKKKQNQREVPFKRTAGSLHLSDVVRKVITAHKIKKSTSNPCPIDIPMRACVGDFLLFTDPERRFSHIVKSENAGLRVDLHQDSIRAWIEFPNGKKIAGEEVLGQIPIDNLKQLHRVDKQTVMNILPARFRKALFGGGIVSGLALFTDYIPVWAEVALAIGVSIEILLERRIQFLATDGNYVLLMDTPELGWYLLDALIHDETWKNGGKK